MGILLVCGSFLQLMVTKTKVINCVETLKIVKNSDVIRDLCKTLPHSLSFLFLSTIGSPAVNIFDF